MKWIKKGIIFNSDHNHPWMQTHASVPIADHLDNDIFRIYFSPRDSQNRSSIGFVDVDITDPSKILKISEEPILSYTNIGAFDDSGVTGSSIVNFEGKKYFYYIGWNVPKQIPFRWSIGLAISSDNGKSFKRFSEGPILDRNYVDPFLVSSPTVILENGLWRMWYISAVRCELKNNQFKAPYHIRYAESKDGINWERKGIVCIDFKDKSEFAIGRASILKDSDIYHMWYSYSSGNYRIGYAFSNDGINWTRDDENAGIDVSKSGWDSKSIEHSFVFRHKSTTYMLYTGNEFGKTGFGYAILEN